MDVIPETVVCATMKHAVFQACQGPLAGAYGRSAIYPTLAARFFHVMSLADARWVTGKGRCGEMCLVSVRKLG